MSKKEKAAVIRPREATRSTRRVRALANVGSELLRRAAASAARCSTRALKHQNGFGSVNVPGGPQRLSARAKR